jgi:hypothetical protein
MVGWVRVGVIGVARGWLAKKSDTTPSASAEKELEKFQTNEKTRL